MTPRISTILLSLLCGVLITVGTAWYQLLAGPIPKTRPTFFAARTDSGSIRHFVLVNRASGFGVDELAFTTTDSMTWHSLGLQVQHRVPDTPSWAPWPREADLTMWQTKLYVACGWPLRCLTADCLEQDDRWYISDSLLGPGGQLRRITRSDRPQGLRRPSVAAPPRWNHAIFLEDQQTSGPFTAIVLPYHVIPVGFIANTLLFSLLVMALLVGSTTALRVTRFKRGKCPRCAYELQGHLANGCSECGWRKVSPKQSLEQSGPAGASSNRPLGW